MKKNKAVVKEYDGNTIDRKILEKTIRECPVNAIEYNEIKDDKRVNTPLPS